MAVLYSIIFHKQRLYMNRKEVAQVRPPPLILVAVTFPVELEHYLRICLNMVFWQLL